ncbi:serine/threonine-protein kinase VRK1-like [Microplitis mediator]|uniref:serine/threonine-protein kinase VRK1-like n=1 Tax=Microplitis mediator TaxID=375433 RepID=UPI0025548161|nr:serine/threonine-protein kinase VRK1-like [Microplitis mediator]
MAANKKKPRKANGYKMPDPIREGEILQDLNKNQWILGKSIGTGGFGEIYSASPYGKSSSKSYNSVIKIEPHGNGPLFVEMHFYMRNSKPDDIESWRSKKKLSHLGMPKFLGSGSHEYQSQRYRFLVMERYGKDLWKLFIENGRKFSLPMVVNYSLQIIDVLEYIHSRTYVHADIKGANLLMDLKDDSRIYLVDFGLASHYTSKDFKIDPKKAHNGTIEYTSRDAHAGVPTMRGDFEILLYNVIQWLCGKLPWEGILKDCSAVQRAKEKAFEDIDTFLGEMFSKEVPGFVKDFMKFVENLKFNEAPDYNKCREIFEVGKSLKGKANGVKVEKKKKKDTVEEIKEEVVKKRERVRTPKQEKKVQVTTPRRKSPRVKPQVSLDDSTVGIVVDRKREKLKDVKAMIEAMDDDSDTEYDVMITKKKKVEKKGRKIKKSTDSGDESEAEVMPRGTKSRQAKISKLSRQVAADSDEDMFD